jgi:hypothetical protein
MAGDLGASAVRHGATVRRLDAIAKQALGMQAEADAAIRACGIVGIVQSGVAVRLGVMLHSYSRLYFDAEAVETGLDAEMGDVRRDLLELLSYHLHMLRDAGDLVFSGRDVPCNERFRLELAEGLGTRAEDLSRLRELLIWDRCD